MSTEHLPKPNKSRKGYLRLLIQTAAEDFSITQIIGEGVAGFAIGFLLLKYGLAEATERPELYFEAIGLAILTPLVIFLIRLVCAPAKLHHELEGKLEKYLSVKSLEIKISPSKSIPFEPQQICIFEIHNENQAVSDVMLRLMKIEPPIPSAVGGFSTEHLSAMTFRPEDLPGNSIKQGQVAHFNIFIFPSSGNSWLQFLSRDLPTQIQTINAFVPQSNPDGYIVTFESSAIGASTKETQFRLLFSPEGKNPPFTVQKI